MLIRISLFIVAFEYICCRNLDIVVKLDSKHLIDSLTSETSVKYLTDLATAFAKKAAETFINEIKSKKHLFKNKRKIRLESNKVNRVQKVDKPKQDDEEVLTENEAFKLLEKPSPDGDNLDWHAPQDLTTEEIEETQTIKKIPVYGLKKVNGIYFRRFLGLL